MTPNERNERVSAARQETEARGETFYPGPSRIDLAAYPPKERWDDWTELDPRSWPQRKERHYTLVPTTVSIANQLAACWLISTKLRERCRSLKAILSIRVRGGATAPKVPPH